MPTSAQAAIEVGDPTADPERTPDDNRLTWRRLLLRGGQVLLVNTAIGLLLCYLNGEFKLATLSYALCIGLCSWLAIDLGRFAFRRPEGMAFPSGGRAVLLCVLGCAIGFTTGTALADLLNGNPVYGAYGSGLRSLVNDLFVSAMIGSIMSGFFYLRGRGRYHRAQIARSERELALARLAVLQTQLEPHMLFNTLANLRALIMLDPRQAQAMLDRLIAHLRSTLTASRNPWHPLSAEFAGLADYLALMGMRMGERLQVDLQLPDELRDLAVPPLLLQPLVENAIKHGLEPKVEGGRIDVQARRQGDVLEFVVRDTGLGLDAAASAPASPDRVCTGFGTTQVRERLATLYGDRASLTLEEAPGDEGGTLVRVRLPFPTQRSFSQGSSTRRTATDSTASHRKP